MRIAKAVIAAVWPVVYSKLSELVEKTDTKFDDLALAAASTFILEWLESNEDE